jgi:hypothetical protein
MFFQGQVLREVSAVTTRQGTPVTALCHDEFCNVLISGDQSKYFFEKKKKCFMMKDVVCLVP